MSIIPPTILLYLILSPSCYAMASDCSNMHQHIRQSDQKFEQKSKRFWQFNEESSSWVEMQLPYDLVSCIDGDCKVVNSIQKPINKHERTSSHPSLPVRKRVSLTKMSETSVWLTGESGSIYERFWNGVQWVIAPHDLPVSAVSVFLVNQTILALSEAGSLYQMQLTEDSQPIWVEFDHSEAGLSSGVVSNDKE